MNNEDQKDQKIVECPEYLIWKLSWASKEKKAFRKMFGKGKLKSMVEDHDIKVLYVNFESKKQLNYDLESIVEKKEVDFIITSSGRSKMEIKGFNFVTSHECEDVPINGAYNSCLAVFQRIGSNQTVLSSKPIFGCPSLQAVKLKFTDFNIVTFHWIPTTLLAEDLHNIAKVLEDNNEDTTFWIGDLNFNATYGQC